MQAGGADRMTPTCGANGTRVRGTHVQGPVKIFAINEIPIGNACAEHERLELFRITKSGLLAITISVFALWGSIALETAAGTIRTSVAAGAAIAFPARKIRLNAVTPELRFPPYTYGHANCCLRRHACAFHCLAHWSRARTCAGACSAKVRE